MIDADKLTQGTTDGQGRGPGSGQANRLWLTGQVHEDAGPLGTVRRAIRYGDGLFATLRIDAGWLLDAERHAARLLAGADGIGLEPPAGWLDEPQIVERLLAAAVDLGAGPGTDGVLRCQWSAVDRGRGYGRSGDSVALVELSEVPADRELGARVLESDVVPRPSIAHIKTCSALPHVIAARLAARLGVEEVLRVYDGWLAEGISANLFFERDGRLFTPSPELPLYPGTVRRRVIEQAGTSYLRTITGYDHPTRTFTFDPPLGNLNGTVTESRSLIGLDAWRDDWWYGVGETIHNGNNFVYECTVSGTTQTPGPPAWSEIPGNSTVDGGATWQQTREQHRREAIASARHAPRTLREIP